MRRRQKILIGKVSLLFLFQQKNQEQVFQKPRFLKKCSENKPFRSTLSAKATQHSANKGLSSERSLHNSEPPPHSREPLGRSLDVSTHSCNKHVCIPSIFSQTEKSQNLIVYELYQYLKQLHSLPSYNKKLKKKILLKAILSNYSAEEKRQINFSFNAIHILVAS